ncbi:MAG: PIN domain-containing protein [Planctomycetota bacterium]|nr:MAG: PIN domain-containing protein [Planctomycetota bacterium]
MSALVDVCVLVAAHRPNHPHHAACLAVLDGALMQGFAWCAHTRNGFVRLVTHERVFPNPTPLAVALATWESWIARPESRPLLDSADADRRWAELCASRGARGNEVYDLHLAALALSAGLPLCSLDQDFQRIPGLHSYAP